MSEGSAGVPPRPRRRWTVGGLMLLVALVAVTLAWYDRRIRDIARERAAADSERAAMMARVERLMKVLEERDRLEQERISLEMARATSPPKPTARLIPEQVRDIVKLLDDRAKLEPSTTGATTPAETEEQPR